MGDRVSTTLTVLKEHQQRAIELIKPEEGEPSYIDDHSEEHIVRLSYDEVNYGTIDNLELLIQEGIPYSFSWGSGGEFNEGQQDVRFSPEGQLLHTGEDLEWPSVLLDGLKLQLDKATSLEQAKQLLQDSLAKHVPISWDNQAEYGRLYRATQLLQPNKE